MPIIKAAIKDLRQANKRRTFNRAIKDEMKESFKSLIKLGQAKKMAEFNKKLPEVMSLIDKAAKHNLIHKNNASNKKARLARIAAAK